MDRACGILVNRGRGRRQRRRFRWRRQRHRTTGRSVTILLRFPQRTERPLQIEADMGIDRPFGSVAGHRAFLLMLALLADRQGGPQFNPAHAVTSRWHQRRGDHRGTLTPCFWGLGQVGARPVARFDAGRKRPEIDHRDTANGLAAIRIAMRDDKVTCAGGLPQAVSPTPKELDPRIEIVAADGTRAPDSHVRRQLIFRLIRYLCRAMRRRRSRIAANQERRISTAGCCL